MFIHSIVFVFLALLSATAAYASSMPISKEPDARQAAPEVEKEPTDIL